MNRGLRNKGITGLKATIRKEGITQNCSIGEEVLTIIVVMG